MMIEETSWITARDGVKLFLRKWKTGRDFGRGVVHIVHGMAEHSARYRETATRLTERGYEVWAADLRGHGMTADSTVNDEGKGGLLGHCADKNAFALFLEDVALIDTEIRRSCPSVPVFLMGHSFGSFIAFGYVESCRTAFAGCILSGTRGYCGLLPVFGAVFMALFSFLRGVRTKSLFASNLAERACNKKFSPNKTQFDWASRDEKEVEAFVKDPLCGKIWSGGFYRDLSRYLLRIYRKRNIKKINKALPFYIFSGGADPVGGMGKGPAMLTRRLKGAGIEDVELVLYPNGRHEMLHETNRAEVTANLCAWLDAHTGFSHRE